MALKKRLQAVSITVKGILEKYPKARDDDYTLYGFYLNSHGISVKTSYLEIYKMIKSGEITSIESVGRARRKIQELYPELSGDIFKENQRRSAEADYKAFARETKI